MLVAGVAAGEVNNGIGAYGLVAPCVVGGGEFCVANIVVRADNAAEVVGYNVVCYCTICIFNMNINQVIGAGHIVAAFANDIRGALLVICIRIVQCYIGFAL